MKTQFKFDKKTGTIVPTNDTRTQAGSNEAIDGVKTSKADNSPKPVFQQENRIDVRTEVPNVQKHQIVKMQRIDEPSAIMLVDKDGRPESYLDSLNTDVMMFRELEDYDRCQIVDEKTGKVLAIIAGYALQINFNMAELNTMERIEQCLQGLTKLFRHKIMSQPLSGD